MNGPEAGPSSNEGWLRRYGSDDERAALVIQRHYRGHQARQGVKRMQMVREARWDDLVKQTGQHTYAEQQLENKNDVKSRWSRAMHAAARLQAGDGLYEQQSIPEGGVHDQPVLSDEIRKQRKARLWGKMSWSVAQERDEDEQLPYTSKAMEQQHWLEMIDGKHRYGSNMKYYFRKWREAETSDNFFRWLDRGDGKDLDLEELPRERLERERITYCSAEQRLNYLVKVDRDGLLRWVHNDELVDTADKKWKDSGRGNGIVPREPGDNDEDDEDVARDSDSISSLSYSAASSDLHENEDTHYAGLDEDKDKSWLAKKAQSITPSGIKKDLLRKTVRRNTWIYISDMKLNLFIGIKKSGQFQHSSFLAGGKVTSAGLIVVKRGVIKSLNPLSGHYRSSINHFRAFIAQLEAKGADLSHVKIAKSILTLWGLSKYATVTKGEKDMVQRYKASLGISHKPTEAEKSAKLQENAEREEREHQERMQAVKQAEGDQSSPEGKERVRKEVLYGVQQEEKAEQKEDTKEETRPT